MLVNIKCPMFSRPHDGFLQGVQINMSELWEGLKFVFDFHDINKRQVKLLGQNA